MRNTGLRRLGAAALGAATIGLMGLAVPAQAVLVAGDQTCVVVEERGHSDAARGGWGHDTRAVSAEEQRAISKRTDRILRAAGQPTAAAVTIPVYVHVMAAKDGDAKRITAEVADLWFHSMIALAQFGLAPADVLAELERREGQSGLEEFSRRKEGL